MTKEYFDSKMQECLNDNWTDEMYNLVYEFFDSNVCIPKGATLQYLTENSTYIDIFHLSNDVSKYRIKPSEPAVYEWQWLDINPINHKAFFINEAKFMTEEECNTYTCYTIPIKIEETKRVRKGL